MGQGQWGDCKSPRVGGLPLYTVQSPSWAGQVTEGRRDLPQPGLVATNSRELLLRGSELGLAGLLVKHAGQDHATEREDRSLGRLLVPGKGREGALYMLRKANVLQQS